MFVKILNFLGLKPKFAPYTEDLFWLCLPAYVCLATSESEIGGRHRGDL